MSRVALTFNLVYFFTFCRKISLCSVKPLLYLGDLSLYRQHSTGVPFKIIQFVWDFAALSECQVVLCIRRKPRFRIILLLLNRVVSLSENNLAEQLTLTSLL